VEWRAQFVRDVVEQSPPPVHQQLQARGRAIKIAPKIRQLVAPPPHVVTYARVEVSVGRCIERLAQTADRFREDGRHGVWSCAEASDSEPAADQNCWFFRLGKSGVLQIADAPRLSGRVALCGSTSRGLRCICNTHRPHRNRRLTPAARNGRRIARFPAG